MTIELPESSAHQSVELLRSVPAAICEPVGNCYYVSCITRRGSNDERRSRQTARTGSYHRRLDIRQAFRDGLEANPLRKVSIKVLYEDPDRGEMTCLLKLEPGAYIPFHKHPEIEQTLVLEGSVEDHDGIATAGDYIWRKPGSLHDNTSPGGAVLFAVYRKPNLYYDAAEETAGF